MKQIRKELKASGTRKALFTLCLAFAGSALIFPAFAGTWFSTSRFAYFGGELRSFGSQKVEGFLVAGPVNAIPGEDPWIELDVFGIGWTCYMTEFSSVKLNSEGKDYCASGTWEIQKGTEVYTDNASDLAPYMAGLDIAKVAIVTFQADISDIKNVVTVQLNITDLTVVYFTDENFTSVSYGKQSDETGKFPPGYVLGIEGLTLGDIDMGISDGHRLTGGYFDSLIFVDWIWGDQGGSRIVARLPSVKSYVSGNLCATGNYTDFTAYMEGIGTFSGKIDAGNVKYDSVEFSWTPETQRAGRTDADPRADLDGDRKVDIRDLFIVARAFGATKGSELYDTRVDINSDDVVNILDITIVAQNFGTTI